MNCNLNQLDAAFDQGRADYHAGRMRVPCFAGYTEIPLMRAWLQGYDIALTVALMSGPDPIEA